MATGWPMKVSYANGDVYSSSDVNDTNGTINLLGASVAYAAGKNGIINGDFRINQRAFTSNTGAGTYNFDRWVQDNSGGSFTVTPQTFTAGAAPLAPYEGRTYLQGITATQSGSGDYAVISQRIEDVTRYAGTTVTISFFAKANTGTPKIGVSLQQVFGQGGSFSAPVQTPAGAVTLSTSWARYSISLAVPSISGKTLGTTANSSYNSLNLWSSAGSTLNTPASSIGIQNFTFSLWGVQIETGSTATAFQTATGTIQGELAACQRYYWRVSANATNSYATFGMAFPTGSTNANLFINFPSQMRVTPTSVGYGGTVKFQDYSGTQGTVTAMAINTGASTAQVAIIENTISGATAGRIGQIAAIADGSAYIGISAEL